MRFSSSPSSSLLPLRPSLQLWTLVFDFRHKSFFRCEVRRTTEFLYHKAHPFSIVLQNSNIEKLQLYCFQPILTQVSPIKCPLYRTIFAHQAGPWKSSEMLECKSWLLGGYDPLFLGPTFPEGLSPAWHRTNKSIFNYDFRRCQNSKTLIISKVDFFDFDHFFFFTKSKCAFKPPFTLQHRIIINYDFRSWNQRKIMKIAKVANVPLLGEMTHL